MEGLKNYILQSGKKVKCGNLHGQTAYIPASAKEYVPLKNDFTVPGFENKHFQVRVRVSDRVMRRYDPRKELTTA